jgi:hypothetical protein
LAGDTAWRNTSRSLLHSEFLVVTIDSLLLIEFVRAKLLTNDTFTKELLSLISRAVESRSFEISTLTPEVHLFKLREHAGSLGHNASEFDEGVQVNLAQVTELILDREVSYSDEDVVVNLVVVGVDF